MAKTAQEWRSEWKTKFHLCRQFYLWRQYWRKDRQLDSARKVRREMSNCVLGYAMARGWWL